MSADDVPVPKMLRQHGIEAVAHGFRSSFRDWAAEKADHPREVIEAALVHVVSNRVEAAYPAPICSSGCCCC